MGKKRYKKNSQNHLKSKNTIPDLDKSKTNDLSNRLNLDILFDRSDIYICSVIVVIFSIIGIWHIGSFNTPTTGWATTHGNESFYIDLKEIYHVNSIYIMEGIHPKIDLNIYFGSPNNWSLLYYASRENFFLSWDNIPVNSSLYTRYLKFIAGSNVNINEIVIYSNNKKIPISKDNIVCEGDCDKGLNNLVDEQNKIEDPPSYLSGTMFDEIYFARTAYQHIIRDAPFEYSHPPLGKLLIATGILMFGLNTIGWRIIPLLFGIIMIPIMYIFGKKLFKNRFGAFVSAFLISLDNMHLVLSRIGITDIILATFIILMFYFFFIYYDKNEENFFKKRNIDLYLPLFLSGIFFGMAVSVKWTAIYGATAVIVLFLMLKKDELDKIKRNRILKPDLLNPIFIILVSYVVISFIIYYLSYVPIMGIQGEGSGLEMILRYQQNMYRYHSTLTATHPFSSPWWSWIFMIKPVWIYTQNSIGTISNIVAIGNPAIWWVSIPFIIFVIYRMLIKKDKIARFISVIFLLQLIPYILIGRITFIYHMFPNVAFMIFAIVYGLNSVRQNDRFRYTARYVIIIYLCIVVISFLYFYPITSAYPISYQFNEAHKWLSSWIF